MGAASGGLVLLLLVLALGVTAVLAVVVVVALRARLRDMENAPRALEAEAGGGPAGAKPAAHARKPALFGWLACSGAAALVVICVGALWLRGCQAIGDANRASQEQIMCCGALQDQSNFFATYWDQYRRLPRPEEVPVAHCPAGNVFRYTGHRNIVWRGKRLLMVEGAAHADGSRRALLADSSLLKSGKTVAEYCGDPGSAVWRRSSYFDVETMSQDEYLLIAEAVEAYTAEAAP